MHANVTRPRSVEGDEVMLARIERGLAAATAGEPAAGDLEAFCAQLVRTAPRPDARFQRQLEAELLTALSAAEPRRGRRAGPMTRRAVFSGAAAAAVLLGGVLTIPTTRAWADDLVVTRLMAHFGLQQGPVNLDKPAGAGVEVVLTRAQAQARLGFAVQLPSALPARYAVRDRLSVYPDLHLAWWRSVRDDGPWSSADRITLEQRSASADQGATRSPLAIGAGQPQAMTVAGAAALWYTLPDQVELDQATGQRTVARYRQVLLWEHDGVQYTLSVPVRMGIDEARTIAASLR